VAELLPEPREEQGHGAVALLRQSRMVVE